MTAYIKNTIEEVTVNYFKYRNGVLAVFVTVKSNGKSFYYPAEDIILWR